YPMKKVGSALNISVATAKAHTETLYQRLDVHNRNAAVTAAVSRGATLRWANIPATAQGQPRHYTGRRGRAHAPQLQSASSVASIVSTAFPTVPTGQPASPSPAASPNLT